MSWKVPAEVWERPILQALDGKVSRETVIRSVLI